MTNKHLLLIVVCTFISTLYKHVIISAAKLMNFLHNWMSIVLILASCIFIYYNSDGFPRMISEAASILSKGYPQMRVDFYDIDGDIRISELTMRRFNFQMQLFQVWCKSKEKR